MMFLLNCYTACNPCSFFSGLVSPVLSDIGVSYAIAVVDISVTAVSAEFAAYRVTPVCVFASADFLILGDTRCIFRRVVGILDGTVFLTFVALFLEALCSVDILGFVVSALSLTLTADSTVTVLAVLRSVVTFFVRAVNIKGNLSIFVNLAYTHITVIFYGLVIIINDAVAACVSLAVESAVFIFVPVAVVFVFFSQRSVELSVSIDRKSVIAGFACLLYAVTAV